jgi:hypothetical protein
MANELIIKNGAIIDGSASIGLGEGDTGKSLTFFHGIGEDSTQLYGSDERFNIEAGVGIKLLSSDGISMEVTDVIAVAGGPTGMEFSTGVGQTFTFSCPTLTGVRSAQFQDSDGTVAYLSDIATSVGDYLPLTGGDLVNGSAISFYDDFGDKARIFGTNAHSGASDLEITTDNGVLHISTDAGVQITNLLDVQGGIIRIYPEFGVNPNKGQIRIAAITSDRTYTLPDASGTIALTGDLSDYLPLAGGTMTGTLSAITINPTIDNAFNFGSPSLKYANLYANRLFAIDSLRLGTSAYGVLSASGTGTGGGVLINGPNSGASGSSMKLQTELSYKGLIIQDSEIAGATRIDEHAILELNSSTRGFLPPRNADPNTNILTLTPGLMAYDSTDNELQYYNGSGWISLTGGSFLPLAGGTMSGVINMDGNTIDFGGTLGSIANSVGILTIQSNKNTTIVANSQTYDFSDSSPIITITGSGMAPGSLGFDATDGTIKATISGIENTLDLSTLPTANRYWEMPDASGTIALTNDLTDIVTAPGSQFNDQIAIFTSDGVIEGDNNFKWNGDTLVLNGTDAEPLTDWNYEITTTTGSKQIINLDITSPVMNGSVEGFVMNSGAGNKGQFRAFVANSSNSVASSVLSTGLQANFDGTDNIKYGVNLAFSGSGTNTYGVFADISTATTVSNVGFYCDVSGGANNYLGQFKDGSEGADKFMKCIDAGGFATWAEIRESEIPDLRANAIIQTGVNNFGPSSSGIFIGGVSIVKITNDGTAYSPTLGPGTDGQRVIFCVVAAGSPAAGGHGITTSGAGSAGWTTITLGPIGDSVELLYDSTVGWIVVGSYGATIT